MGFSAITKAKKDFAKQQASFEGLRTRDMRLVKDGDSAVIWFIGCDPDEPREALVHTVNTKYFSYELCAHGAEDHEGCVYCHVAAKGDKRVKRPSKNFYFSIADSRWVHKTKNDEESSKAGRDVFDWADCPRDDDTPDAKCVHCKRKVPRERGGLKKLRLGLQTAIVVDGLNTRLKKKCVCGGKTIVSGYKHGKKTIPTLDDVDEDEVAKWAPVYDCSKCDSPQPGSIYTCPIRMSRSGSGQTTTYSFEKEDDAQDQPDWVQELAPLDWDKVLSPRTADQMAKQLDIANPFIETKSKGKKSDSYDEDDDDEPFDDDDEDEDDDDDDEKPKKKGKK